MRALRTGVVASVLLLTAACGADHSVTVVDTQGSPSPAASSLLHRAASSTAEYATGRIIETIRESGSVIPKADQITIRSTGSFDRSHHASEMTMSFAGVPGGVAMHMIEIGDTIYMDVGGMGEGLGSPSKPWVSMTEQGLSKTQSSLGAAANGPEGELGLLKSMSGHITVVGPAIVDGQPTTHMHTTIDLSQSMAKLPADERKAMQQLFGSSGMANPFDQSVPIDVWVDHEDHILKEAVDESFAGFTMQMTIQFVDLGQPVSIKAPPASEVTPESSDFGNVLIPH